MYVINSKEAKKNESKTISVLVQFAKDRRINSMRQAKNEYYSNAMKSAV